MLISVPIAVGWSGERVSELLSERGLLRNFRRALFLVFTLEPQTSKSPFFPTLHPFNSPPPPPSRPSSQPYQPSSFSPRRSSPRTHLSVASPSCPLGQGGGRASRKGRRRFYRMTVHALVVSGRSAGGKREKGEGRREKGGEGERLTPKLDARVVTSVLLTPRTEVRAEVKCAM